LYTSIGQSNTVPGKINILNFQLVPTDDPSKSWILKIKKYRPKNRPAAKYRSITINITIFY